MRRNIYSTLHQCNNIFRHELVPSPFGEAAAPEPFFFKGLRD